MVATTLKLPKHCLLKVADEVPVTKKVFRQWEMSGNYFAVSAVKRSNQEDIVPYFGRDGVVVTSDTIYQLAAESLIEASTSIATTALSKKLPMWTSLSEELARFCKGFLDPEVPIKRYQLDLLVEALIPYLQDRKNQLHTTASRFSQIETLLRILSGSDSSHVSPGSAEISNHPYHSLIKIERLIVDINREGGMWKSKLSTALQQGVKKQWEPIIGDHQRALSSIGGKLCMLGLVEAVGRPIVMLYPLFLVAQEALKIASEIEVKKNISVRSIMQIAKMLVMLLGVGQLSGILSMYTGLGYTCLALGCVALFISSNDELTKSAVPVLAPHMVNINLFMDRLYQLESLAVSAFSRLNSSSSNSATTSFPSSSSVGNSRGMPTDSRVEELPAEEHTQAPTQISQSIQNPVSYGPVFSPFHGNVHDAVPVASAISNTASPRQLSTIYVSENVDDDDDDDGGGKVEDDYVFAELDVYAAQTQALNDSRVTESSYLEGLRQRKHA